MAHPISASADTQIDYETYSQKIKEKYAEFGINLETQEIDNKFIYTEEQLNRELEKISENVPQYASITQFKCLSVSRRINFHLQGGGMRRSGGYAD